MTGMTIQAEAEKKTSKLDRLFLNSSLGTDEGKSLGGLFSDRIFGILHSPHCKAEKSLQWGLLFWGNYRDRKYVKLILWKQNEGKVSHVYACHIVDYIIEYYYA